MPQKSYGFAIGRVRVLEQSLMRPGGLERLASAGSVGGLARALAELGWGEARTRADIEQLCERRCDGAVALVRDISPEPDVTDSFLLKYDALNAKLLLRARHMGLPAPALSLRGTIDPDRLARAVSETNYRGLPDGIGAALDALEGRIALEGTDPLRIDAALDRAAHELALMKLRRAKCGPALRYFRDKADLTNLLTALRCGRMRRGARFALALMLPGGALDAADVARAADDPGRAAALAGRLPYDAPPCADLPLFERRMDDHLLALIRPHRWELDTAMPLVGYLLARDREAAAVRWLAACMGLNVPRERLAEGLRELYTA